MEENKPVIKYPILVEGKYDKVKIKSIFSATVITTEGFGVFKSEEKQALIRRLAKSGLIILTDSDGAGGVIRSFIKGILPPEKIYNLYIPKLHGKEKRKSKPSCEGLLGVEGMEKEALIKVLSPFIESDKAAVEKSQKCKVLITKTQFFLDGLSGGANSTLKRDALAKHFDLPNGMSANALLEALNIIASLKEYEEALKKFGL